MMQGELFEPSGAEVLPLAEQQQRLADLYRRRAEACALRGWEALARIAARASQEHERAAVELAMLADFERLAGLAA